MSAALHYGATNGTDFSLTVLKARIALLATAIGGPDYTSEIEPPPYKLGDDCLACLKDLKRWFKLVDDQQKRWDVAMAVAEYRILTDDLLPILIDWENRCSLAAKLAKNNPEQGEFRNKAYYDKIAMNCLQLLVLMTWPLIITEQSSSNQITLYSELKKHQLIYKKAILSMENGKVLRAAIRLALGVIKIDRLSRTPRDNMVLKLVLNFFRNVIAIEPGEFTINTKRSMPSKGISSIDTLPPNVSMDDISLNTVISSFHKNKVFGLLLTLANSLSKEYDQDFINIPLLEIMFFLTKDVNQSLLFPQQPGRKPHHGPANANGKISTSNVVTSAGFELSKLLQKEHQMKKNVIKHTSARHSRFGGLLSIQTPDKNRLTVSGSQALVDENIALQKLDDSKKWNKRITQKRESVATEGLPNSLLNSQTGKAIFFTESNGKHFKKFINDFIDSGFNILLHSVTNCFTTEQDRMVTLEQVEYLLFFAWFINYQLLRCKMDSSSKLHQVSEALKEVSFILVSSLLRNAYDLKNWIVTHAGMIAFNELLNLVAYTKAGEGDSDDIEFIVSRLFSDERIQLLSNLPKIGSKHSLQFMKSCIELTHSVLKVLEQYSDDKTLVVEGKSRRRKKLNVSEDDISRLIEEENVDRDEALDILTSNFRGIEVNFQKVQSNYMTEPVVETYINFLQRFRELEDDSIKKVFSFFHRVFVQAKEQSLLFRFDLIILLREMLSSDGLNRMSRSRKYVSQFSDYFLTRLKKRLKKSPAWFVGLLFPPLHNSEVGFYQKYGEYSVLNNESLYASSISQFKPIPDEEALPPSVLQDMRYGILVSTLLDDGKAELLDQLLQHITHTLNVFKSWLSVNVNAGRETMNPPNEFFVLTGTLNNDPLFRDKDYRALLSLIGYSVPDKINEPCFLAGTIEIPDLTTSCELIKKYLSTPFETPNGLPSSSYLVRVRSRKENLLHGEQDGWEGNDHYDYTDPHIIPDDQEISEGDEAYFKDLDNNVSEKLKGVKLSRGIARSKKKEKKRGKKRAYRNNLATFDNEDGQQPHSLKERHSVFSKEFISDSEDDEDLMNPIFFENETYMRWLLDKNNGQLTEDRYAQFAKFAAERMANGGVTTGDYTNLFGGFVPSISDIGAAETSSFAPDKSLISLASHVASEMSAADADNNTELSDDDINSELKDNLGSPQLSDSYNDLQSDEDNRKVLRKRKLEDSEVDKEGEDEDEDEDEEAFLFSVKKSKVILDESDGDDE
ncbi:hypothetical protein N7582_004715 [Saccharomyces uvarum]|uniref:Topoisomerase 1-associated factor 1 n=1 Tax=Saccharomyces uvarum TaxID=230603 RepID=A0AA35J6F8_SACUV|nr:hypothetical protein N7582_004715 [Saccharomyces uvarum]CAI4049635.1 hypothetical protein SUVC_14G0590 [Saccharomyces uvarum]